MSAYDDYVLSTNPGFYNPLTELPGVATYEDLTAQNLDLTTSGTVDEGSASVLPAYPTERAIFTAQTAPFASRGNNAVFDQPATPNRLALQTWIVPETIRTTDMPLIYKHGMYGLIVTMSGALRGVVTGQTDLTSKSGWIQPLSFYCCQMRFHAVEEVWQLLVNGHLVAEKAIAPSALVPYTTNALQLGGQTAFGSSGYHGRMGRVAKWDTVNCPSLQSLQNLYAKGTTTVETYPNARDVFAWPTTVRGSVPAGQVWEFVNESDSTIWVQEGGLTVVVGGGHRLLPGESRAITDSGAVNAIHRSMGPKRLSMARRA